MAEGIGKLKRAFHEIEKRRGNTPAFPRRLFINPREKAVAEPVAIPHHNQSCHDPLSRARASHIGRPPPVRVASTNQVRL